MKIRMKIHGMKMPGAAGADRAQSLTFGLIAYPSGPVNKETTLLPLAARAG
jgi:hypothetical protein